MQPPYPHGSYPQRPYPYVYAQPRQQPIDPRYVGPQWAAPGPRRALPPQKKTGGCLVAFLAVLTVVGVMLGGLVLLIVIGAAANDDASQEDEVIDLPDEHAKLPTKTPLAVKGDAVTEASWNTGVCGDYSKERDRSVYYATKNDGSAHKMRGKVAVIHLRMQSASMRWTKNGELNVNRAGLMSQRYITTQAKRYQVADLKYDVIPDYPPFSGDGGAARPFSSTPFARSPFQAGAWVNVAFDFRLADSPPSLAVNVDGVAAIPTRPLPFVPPLRRFAIRLGAVFAASAQKPFAIRFDNVVVETK